MKDADAIAGAGVLTVALTIVLTLHRRADVKRQSIGEQLARNRASAIDVVKVKSGQGLS